MSNISSVYDAFLTRVATVLPNHTRLSNPYDLSQNVDAFLRQGYGIAIGSGVNSERTLCPIISIRRSFIVAITRKYYAIDTNVSAKATIEKQLFEDQLLIIKDLCDNSSLSGEIGLVNFESDGGIEQVFGEKDNYLALQTTFSVETFDQV